MKKVVIPVLIAITLSVALGTPVLANGRGYEPVAGNWVGELIGEMATTEPGFLGDGASGGHTGHKDAPLALGQGGVPEYMSPYMPPYMPP